MKPHLYQSSVLPAISHIALLNMGMGLGLIVSHAGWYEPIQKELLQFGWSVLHLCSAGPQCIQICKIQNMLAKIYIYVTQELVPPNYLPVIIQRTNGQ